MPIPRSIARSLAPALTAAVLAAACTTSAGSPTPGPGEVPASPAPSPSAPAFELSVRVRDVHATGVESGVRPRDLRTPTRAIRSTMTELYSIGFVDSAAWQGGAFPSLFRLFAGDARRAAEQDLQRLTLGREARELDAVEPTNASVSIDFLADAAERPLVAVADMRFAGVGLRGDERRRIRQQAEYTLRKRNGGWRIVGYDAVDRTVEPSAPAAFAPGFPSRRPMVFLVIGSDARPGQSVTATRADSLHLVGVNPREGRVSILGIPRDSWVPIPGAGTNKINASLVDGGPDLVVRTVEALTGISIDGYVLTGFHGFQRMVSRVGGLDITIPQAIEDPLAHAHLQEGRRHLTGKEALAFSRARHALANGDFGRSLNQGRVLIAALATLRKAVATSGASALFPWAVAAARDLRTDLPLDDLTELLLAAPGFEPGRIRNEVASGHVGSVGGLSVVFLDGGAVASFRDLARDGVLGG
jgi:LCP family protein required for cell wall assembly